MVVEGIPFAQPPERWKAPQPPQNWGALIADTFGPQCAQYSGPVDVIGQEDCLYLNVWRPRTQERNLPVYFYIHGGGNSIGSGSDSTNLGNKLAPRANMVVVTINYRLGPLGWFVLPESLQSGDPWTTPATTARWILFKRLRWVRTNIAAFGGNPNNITIGRRVCRRHGRLHPPHLTLGKVCFIRPSPKAGGFFTPTNSMEAGRASAQAAIDRMVVNDGCTDTGCYPPTWKPT